MTERRRPIRKAGQSGRPLPAAGVRLQTFVPWAPTRRKSPRREIVTPDGASQTFQVRSKATEAQEESTLIRALGLAYYWQHLLDEGRIASPGAIAQLEGLDASHVRRLLRLTLLAPTVIDQMVNSESLSFDRIVRTPWPDDWWRQAGLLRSLADSV